MRIDFLYWEECPSHEEALDRLRSGLAEAGMRDEITVTHVATEAQARALAFPGSPTIRLDGRDIQPETAAEGAGRLTCRLYLLEDGRPSPLPSREMIRRRLAEQAVAQATKGATR